jgi:putative hydrolase of the HAD superfamily
MLASMIKAVIFDYGNVLSGPQDGKDAEEMEKLTGIPAPFFMEAHPEHRTVFDRGLIDGPELYRRILQEAGRSDLAENSVLMQRLAQFELEHWRPLDTATVDWALSLQKQGYKLGILSNMPHEFLDHFEKDIDVFIAADFACFSCRVGFIKPEADIYHVALKGLGVLPSEAVFFDDLDENIVAAEKVGIRSILWRGLEDAKEKFSAFL